MIPPITGRRRFTGNFLCNLLMFAALSPCLGGGGESRPTVHLASAKQVELSGLLGTALRRGIERLSKPPYTEQWLRADVSFEIKRIYTHYSGDVSGRFLELAALTAPELPTLQAMLKTVPNYQKPDGHFGVDVDLTKPLVRESPPITMLWGNARLLVGLVTCAARFDDPRVLQAARRLGDFYVVSAGNSAIRRARTSTVPAARTRKVILAATSRPSKAWPCFMKRPETIAI